MYVKPWFEFKTKSLVYTACKKVTVHSNCHVGMTDVGLTFCNANHWDMKKKLEELRFFVVYNKPFKTARKFMGT